MTERIFVISHASDIDGVGSASLMRIKYGLPKDHIFFADYSAETIRKISEALIPEAAKGITLMVSDLGMSPAIMPGFIRLISAIRKHNGRVMWFDHHQWTAEQINNVASKCDFATVGENKSHCATEIVSRELGITSQFVDKFVRMVHYSDFNIRPKDQKTYEAIGIYALSIAKINTYNSYGKINSALRKLTETIKNGKMYDADTKRMAKEFEKINNERSKRMIKSAYEYGNIVVGFEKDIQKTKACMDLIAHAKKRVGIYINVRNGRGHIRSIGPDCTNLARHFGGNGHPRACGFSINMQKYGFLKKREDRERLAKEIESVASKTIRFQ